MIVVSGDECHINHVNVRDAYQVGLSELLARINQDHNKDRMVHITKAGTKPNRKHASQYDGQHHLVNSQDLKIVP